MVAREEAGKMGDADPKKEEEVFPKNVPGRTIITMTDMSLA